MSKRKKWALMVGLAIAGIIFFVIKSCLPTNQVIDDFEEKRFCTRKISEQDRIWVISDIHYLSDSLFNQEQAFQSLLRQADGKDIHYQKQRLESLIWQIQEKRPQLLIISGDLTFNGERQSAIDLSEYLRRIEALGTQVYVIPGNHDISNGWSASYLGNQTKPVPQLLPEEFAEIFHNMGYSEACFKDKFSLSYAVRPFKDVLLVMIDTNHYTDKESRREPEIQGSVGPKTYEWLEEVLAYGERNQLLVIPVLHHNTLKHHPVYFQGFVLNQEEKMQQLLARYHVKLTLSGHSHAQNIASKTIGDQKMWDIVTGCFASLSNSIGEIQITQKEINYQRQELMVEEWAEERSEKEEELINYREYSQSLFFKDRINMAYEEFYDEKWFDGETAYTIANFVSRVYTLYFDGKAISDEISQEETESEPGYQLLKMQTNSRVLEAIEAILEMDQESQEVSVLR
ncbi:metallophosphoesterase [Vagococcus sp. BWB3-3]|uniref:Metallophosphoesterase n=1 Tax=Vagococcus allomyrinae TaxID=2794353 RepID=A0A940PB35_9ENTE|nr:metallophosphoesterase [Vagococcus allomyrinae]MBP1039428.1 metallophosphoesterase [Vagococcus allomyrinae]